MESKRISGVSNRELYYISNNTDKFYNRISIPKKTGGVRIVYAPKPQLKWCQHYIAENYLDVYRESKYATAYHKGSNILANASPHCNKKNVLKLDIEDFFGSITFMQVYNVFYKCYPANVSKQLAELCCYHDSLVQGSPASPKLSNVVMYSFDNKIGKWCEERNITYTRYCDDLTFSSNDDLHSVYYKVKSLLKSNGFYLNNKKTHFVNANHRQSVTGIVVNEFPQVSKEYRKKLRQEIYYCQKYGIKNHLKHIGSDLTEEEYCKVLKGKINYVLSVNPNDLEFKNLQQSLYRDNI